jgi:predicted N-acyltransferase
MNPHRTTVTLSQAASISDVPAADWDALTGTGQPFIRHGFLAALETSASAGAAQGWQPAHLLLHDATGELVAAAPLYLKDHSFGEFVFDFAWADAYHRIGLPYYPKLVNAVPFTPVAGPRLLARDDRSRRALAGALAELPARLGVSSLHSLFGDKASTAAMAGADAHTRRGCQYRWFNRDYADFDAFLAQLSAKRRKEIRRERRRVQEMGITVRAHRAGEIPAGLWSTLYSFYGRTYAVRGQAPYLSPEFFAELTARMADQALFFVAWHGDAPVGMAFMMRGGDTLYGRHWGCANDYHSLHFETCYYAGIEYCIEQGLACFDAGVQGEHKIRRGFEPVPTWSTHVIADPQMSRAVGDFVAREGELVAAFQAQQRARCNFDTPPAVAPS